MARSTLPGEWVAMHSVNCSVHEYKHWCEIDFLLIGPPGLFVLEVKGGRIILENGTWRYRDRFGVDHKSSEGPFVQARGAARCARGARSVARAPTEAPRLSPSAGGTDAVCAFHSGLIIRLRRGWVSRNPHEGCGAMLGILP